MDSTKMKGGQMRNRTIIFFIIGILLVGFGTSQIGNFLSVSVNLEAEKYLFEESRNPPGFKITEAHWTGSEWRSFLYYEKEVQNETTGEIEYVREIVDNIDFQEGKDDAETRANELREFERMVERKYERRAKEEPTSLPGGDIVFARR